jgi:hypothetical protein
MGKQLVIIPPHYYATQGLSEVELGGSPAPRYIGTVQISDLGGNHYPVVATPSDVRDE